MECRQGLVSLQQKQRHWRSSAARKVECEEQSLKAHHRFWEEIIKPSLLSSTSKATVWRMWCFFSHSWGHTSEDLFWSDNTTALVREAQQRLHFLKVLRKKQSRAEAAFYISPSQDKDVTHTVSVCVATLHGQAQTQVTEDPKILVTLSAPSSMSSAPGASQDWGGSPVTPTLWLQPHGLYGRNDKGITTRKKIFFCLLDCWTCTDLHVFYSTMS